MTDDLDPDDPGALRRLLQSIESDESRVSPNRDRIRADVLGAFDTADPTVVDLVSPVTPRAEIVELAGHDIHRPISKRRAAAWAVAAAVLLVATGSTVLISRDRWQTAAADPDQPRLAEEGSRLPVELDAGLHVTAVIGSRLSFEVPGGVFLWEESNGRIILGGIEQTPQSGQIVIAELAVDDLENELRVLADDGRINLKVLAATIGGRSTNRWDITVSNSELSEAGCEVGRPCLALPGTSGESPPSLWGGADNRVTEVGRSGDTVVVVLEQSLAFTGPISLQASEILGTLEYVPD